MIYVQMLHAILNSIKLEFEISLCKNDENDIFAFVEKMALQNFFIFCYLLVYVLSKAMRYRNLGSPCFLTNFSK